MLELIADKRDGRAHSPEELRFIARAAAAGSVPDYQLSAWLMAVCCRGMTRPETVELTRAMASSGRRLNLRALRAPKLDKHSTGGVGDGISLALAPLVAEAGLVVPMMSGRGLGHTGGTLDKLEAIRGLRVRLSPAEILPRLRSVGACMFGQTSSLAPADRKLYQLRDATATIQSPPLVVASILSKKLAEDLDALVLDVKVGSGAIFQDQRRAEELARELVGTARGLGLRCVALLTAMEQPLGRYVGNALEIRQAVEILQGDRRSADYLEVLLALGGWMVHLGGKAKSPRDGSRLLEGLIRSGRAYERLRRLVAAQGGDVRQLDDAGRLPRSRARLSVAAPRRGYLSRLDARLVGEAAVRLGAGRQTMEESLDYGAGLVLEKKVGDYVRRGETLATLYGADSARLKQGLERFAGAFSISARAPAARPVVLKTLA